MAMIECRVQKRFATGDYLLTLAINCDHGGTHAYPQAHAVVDDFGTLQITRNWR